MSKRRRQRNIIFRVEGVKVKISAPYRVSQKEIAAAFATHQAWIDQQLAKAKQQLQQVAYKQYVAGGQFDYLGMRYHLQIIEQADRHGAVELNQLTLQVFVNQNSPKRIAQILSNWYQQQALQLFQQKAAALANDLGLAYSTIEIGCYKSRWGCCDAKGALRFNWLLIQAPMQIIDYVVAHEVAHLQYLEPVPKPANFLKTSRQKWFPPDLSAWLTLTFDDARHSSSLSLFFHFLAHTFPQAKCL